MRPIGVSGRPLISQNSCNPFRVHDNKVLTKRARINNVTCIERRNQPCMRRNWPEIQTIGISPPSICDMRLLQVNIECIPYDGKPPGTGRIRRIRFTPNHTNCKPQDGRYRARYTNRNRRGHRFTKASKVGNNSENRRQLGHVTICEKKVAYPGRNMIHSQLLTSY